MWCTRVHFGKEVEDWNNSGKIEVFCTPIAFCNDQLIHHFTMKPILFILLMGAFLARGQTAIFSGFINQVPVNFVSNTIPGGVTKVAYAYRKFDSPIGASGTFKHGTLVVVEDNGQDTMPSVFELVRAPNNAKALNGKWISYFNRSMMDVELVQLASFESYDETAFEELELLQLESTRKHYFKVVLAKEVGDAAEVIGVRVFEKGSDNLLQEFPLECQYVGLQNITLGDFNFDGQMDFSVFESSYSGANTSSIYFLRDTTTGLFKESEIAGSSLQFDSESRRIIERNQCCAGTQEVITSYSWGNNAMLRQEKKCFIFNDETESFEETDCRKL